jgi:hypothetical protein
MHYLNCYHISLGGKSFNCDKTDFVISEFRWVYTVVADGHKVSLERYRQVGWEVSGDGIFSIESR